MKRLIVPALAMGLAISLTASARADGLFGCRDNCDPCKPKCSWPKLTLCKPACERPCKPACPKPCDPCDPCGGHFSKLKGLFHGHGHCKSGCDRCSPCGAPADAGHEPHAKPMTINTTPTPRLNPVPTNASTRTTTRTFSY